MSRQKTLTKANPATPTKTDLEEVQQAVQMAIAGRLNSAAFSMDDRVADLGISCCQGLIGDVAHHFGQSFTKIKNENDHDLTGNQLAQLIWEQHFAPKKVSVPS